MAEIQASQHIYANVEKEQSPRGRGGFQTLFYTHARLTESEVSEMEGRLPYFPSETEPTKKLFFSLTTGKVVVGQIVPLAEADSAGRKGRYLAHSLLFAPEDFARAGANPFALLDGFPFATTIAEALSKGDFSSGEIGSATVDLGGETDAGAREWAKEELVKLVLLGLRARRLAAERTPVAFVGQPDQVGKAAAAVWFALPTALRPHCTFDTYFYRCNLVATFYWGVGLLDDPPNPNLPVVDPAARQVKKTLFAEPETSYERWALTAIEAGNLPQVAEQRDTAFALAEFLDERDHDSALVESAAAGTVRSVLDASPLQLRARLRGRLEEVLPPQLTDRTFAAVQESLDANGALERLRHGFDLSEVLNTLYHVYAKRGFSRPGGKERKELEEVLQKAEHGQLAALLACWTRHAEQIHETLTQLGEDAYRDFVQAMVRNRVVNPWTVLIPGRGEEFVRSYLASTSDPKLLDLVGALLDTENADALSFLARKIRDLPEKQLRKLHKTAQGVETVPESFRDAVARAVDALPPPGGVRGLLRKVLLFGRHRDDN